MDLPHVLLAGVFNFSLAVIAALFGATQSVGDVAGIDFFARHFWRDALDAGSPLADLIMAHKVAAVCAGAVTLGLVGLATGIGRTLLRDFRFRLDRAPTGFRRRRGLLTLTDVSLPLARVQAAIIGSGPLRAYFGWQDLKLQSLATDEGGKGDHLVAPLARGGHVAAILAHLQWRPVDASVAWRRVSTSYAWGLTLLLSLLFIPAVVQLAVKPSIGIILCALIATAIGTRWLAWRRFRYALDGDRLLIRSGWWNRRTLIVPLASIQSADVKENIISRRLGTASLAIGVASGRGFSGHAIPALPRDTARALRDALLAPFA